MCCEGAGLRLQECLGGRVQGIGELDSGLVIENREAKRCQPRVKSFSATKQLGMSSASLSTIAAARAPLWRDKVGRESAPDAKYAPVPQAYGLFEQTENGSGKKRSDVSRRTDPICSHEGPEVAAQRSGPSHIIGWRPILPVRHGILEPDTPISRGAHYVCCRIPIFCQRIFSKTFIWCSWLLLATAGIHGEFHAMGRSVNAASGT